MWDSYLLGELLLRHCPKSSHWTIWGCPKMGLPPVLIRIFGRIFPYKPTTILGIPQKDPISVAETTMVLWGAPMTSETPISPRSRPRGKSYWWQSPKAYWRFPGAFLKSHGEIHGKSPQMRIIRLFCGMPIPWLSILFHYRPMKITYQSPTNGIKIPWKSHPKWNS